MIENERVAAADVMSGNILIHFNESESVLFQGQYLYGLRHQDGNQIVSNEEVERDEQEARTHS